jgi:hypothetical protein
MRELTRRELRLHRRRRSKGDNALTDFELAARLIHLGLWPAQVNGPPASAAAP